MAAESTPSEFETLQALFDAIPKAPLSVGEVGNGGPGILVGSTAICRLKNDGVGAAYGELIVAAVNALPRLLATSKIDTSSVAAARVDTSLRELMLERISSVLSMRPGAAKSSPIWSKLILTSVESVIESMTGSTDHAVVIQRNTAGAGAPSHEQRLKLEGVLSFAAFLLGSSNQGDVSEEVMDAQVSGWATANGINAEPSHKLKTN